jgi:hypothetical protein
MHVAHSEHVSVLLHCRQQQHSMTRQRHHATLEQRRARKESDAKRRVPRRAKHGVWKTKSTRKHKQIRLLFVVQIQISFPAAQSKTPFNRFLQTDHICGQRRQKRVQSRNVALHVGIGKLVHVQCHHSQTHTHRFVRFVRSFRSLTRCRRLESTPTSAIADLSASRTPLSHAAVAAVTRRSDSTCAPAVPRARRAPQNAQ